MKKLMRKVRGPVLRNSTIQCQRHTRPFFSRIINSNNSSNNNNNNNNNFNYNKQILQHSLNYQYDIGIFSQAILNGSHPFFNIRVCHFGSNASTLDVPVPNLGDSVPEGTIRTIHKKVGDSVQTDEVILDIETDKVSIEIRAPKSGVITKFYKQEKNDVQVGEMLFSMSTDGSKPSTSSSGGNDNKSTSKFSPSPSSSASASASPSSTSKSSSPPSSSSTQTSSKPSTPSSAPKKSDASSSSNHRTPMIQFRYGKRDANEMKKEPSSHSTSGTDKAETSSSSSSSSSMTWQELPSKFQNRSWTALDIEVINSGGADLWDLKQLMKPKPKKKQTKAK